MADSFQVHGQLLAPIIRSVNVVDFKNQFGK
jgi:hypothetical protein